MTARFSAEGWELTARKDAFQIPHLGLPSRARPIEFLAELLQRHPLHRFLHCSNRLT